MCSSTPIIGRARRRAAWLAVLVLTILALAAPAPAQSTPAGTVIRNRAQVSYTEPDGTTVTTESPVVTVIVSAVKGVTVTPDEDAPSGQVSSHDRATVAFDVCNTGNTPLSYVVGSASVTAPASVDSVHLDSDASGTVTEGDDAVTLGVTKTPVTEPGVCTPVLILYSTNDAQAQSRITATLAAFSPAGAGGDPLPRVEDFGTVIRTVKDGPRFRDPDNPSLPPRKSVNEVEEVTAGAGALVDFEVAFRNVGESTARNTRIFDELPSGLIYHPGTLRLTAGSQTIQLTDDRDEDAGEAGGQTVEARVPAVAPQEVVMLRFSARVAQLPGGAVLINRARVSADNAPPTDTREVRVIVAPQGMVFDGGIGSSAPVHGASIRILSGSPQGQLASLAPAPGFTPNTDNANPFITGFDGLFSFRLASSTSPQTFFILVNAPDFKPRVIEAQVSPQGSGRFQLRLSSQDSQPVCPGGSFALTTGVVEIDNLAALVANIPMFSAGGLEINKTADRASASIGDVVTYRVEVKNTGRAPAFNVIIRDTLPQSFNYVPGSGVISLGGPGLRAIEPELVGDDIVFTLPRIGGGETASVTYRVRIGVNARIGEQFNVAIAFNGSDPTPPTRVGVVVRGGIFSTNQFLVGRVYADLNRNGHFDKQDRPFANARLITSNGRIVLTDAAGNYNFPVLADGALVVQLDPSSIPEGYRPRDARRSDSSAWSHIVATPLQGGAMLQLSFALEPVSDGFGATDALTNGGQERVGSVSLGRRDAGPVSSAQSTPEPEQKSRERKSWARRFFGTFFGTSKPSKDKHAKYKIPVPAPATVVIASSPEPAATGEVVQQVHFTPDMTTPVATNTAVPDDKVEASSGGDSAIVVQTARAIPASLITPAPVNDKAITPASPDAVPKIAGVAKVVPGNVELDVEPNYVSLKPGFDVPVRVALGWDVRLFLNDRPVDANRVGERRKDQGTQTEQFTFVGLDLTPGPNRLRAVAVSPEGHERAVREVVVYGRGFATRLVLEPAQPEISAGRRASTELVVRAFDEWGNPAQDGDVIVQTTAGAFAISKSSESGALPLDAPQGAYNRPSPSTEIQQQSSVHLVGGVGRVQLVSGETPGTARVTVATAATTAESQVRFGVEDMPRVLVGYGNLTFGRAAPLNILRGVDDKNVRGSMAFFFRGRIHDDQVLTLAYDSQRPLQRLDGRDRLFQTDPLENQYSVFGDTSTRFNAAPSNTKVYARWDLGREYGRSFLTFGDYIPEKKDAELSVYSRRITGAQIHFENNQGDFIDFGAANPDTLFGRDVFPGGSFGFSRLSSTLVLPGSESVVVETRDRRNPDLVIRSEQLVRGVDYNLDADSGQIFFKRVVDPFDADLNLRQVVVTYEYSAQGKGTLVYTARLSKTFRSTGTRVGFSINLQQQRSLGNFVLGGLDFTQKTPHGGELHLEYARSTGKVGASGTYFTGTTDIDRQGNAYLATLNQPIEWRNARLQMSFRRAGAGFYNPFGGTIVGGSQRAGVSLDLQASPAARLRLGFTDERNKTENVNNNRQTFSAQWTQRVRDNLTATLAYDFRHLSNDATGGALAEGVTNSHLITAGIEWKPTDRLTMSARREQNLTDSDPTYPNQTVFSGYYKLNDFSRLFVTQRLASASINPISDLTGGGFAFSQSKREFAAGIETKVMRDTSLVGGYRIEDGLNGSDGYAILGLARTWKLNKTLSLDGSFERAFHLSGRARRGYSTLASGLTWNPRENFIANSSYQWRNREGSGHTLAAGFAGKPFDRVTALGSFQWSRGSGLGSVGSTVGDSFDGAGNSGTLGARGYRQGVYGSFGIALRPLSTDRYAAFFNYQHRSSKQDVGAGAARFLSSEHSNTVSADGFLQAHPKVALFGKVAVKSTNNLRDGVVSAPTLTYLLQARAEYRVAPKWDFAIESRLLSQPSTHSSRVGAASEVGYWATPDIRFGVGYNFNRALEPGRSVLNGDRRGFYFSITTKFERVFDFFGARKKEGK